MLEPHRRASEPACRVGAPEEAGPEGRSLASQGDGGWSRGEESEAGEGEAALPWLRPLCSAWQGPQRGSPPCCPLPSCPAQGARRAVRAGGARFWQPRRRGCSPCSSRDAFCRGNCQVTPGTRSMMGRAASEGMLGAGGVY